jgi:hypothetical protein
MSKISCVFSYEITKGMKSFGPKGLLKAKKNSNELINCQINNVNIFDKLCLVVGFGADKLIKKIKDHTNYGYIYNNDYNTFNEGHALQLILKQYNPVGGLLLINSGILANIKQLNFESSLIAITKKQECFSLGCIINEKNNVENIFYNVGEYSWCEIVYFSATELNMLKEYVKKNNVQNMFLFEIINHIIDAGGTFKCCGMPSNKIVKIQGIKDSSKIKDHI